MDLWHGSRPAAVADLLEQRGEFLDRLRLPGGEVAFLGEVRGEIIELWQRGILRLALGGLAVAAASGLDIFPLPGAQRLRALRTADVGDEIRAPRLRQAEQRGQDIDAIAAAARRQLYADRKSVV